MNLELLVNKIEESKISRSTIAETIGITRQGLYNKLDGKKEFKVSEINQLSKILKLTSNEREAIFFSDYVG